MLVRNPVRCLHTALPAVAPLTARPRHAPNGVGDEGPNPQSPVGAVGRLLPLTSHFLARVVPIHLRTISVPSNPQTAPQFLRDTTPHAATSGLPDPCVGVARSVEHCWAGSSAFAEAAPHPCLSLERAPPGARQDTASSRSGLPLCSIPMRCMSAIQSMG